MQTLWLRGREWSLVRLQMPPRRLRWPQALQQPQVAAAAVVVLH
jgi:hypothetical protein